MAEQRVLFVDDEPNILSTLRRLCRREGYTVLTAGSGPEALDLLRQTPAQVILSDYRMPEMTGVEFLSQAKQIVPDSIRIILSGFADTQAVVEAINTGEVYRFLGKPWDDRDLLATIKQSLEQYELRRENSELQVHLKQKNEELQTMLDRLEDLVAERTRSLAFSQEVLEQLPVGILGLSSDGEVMLSNAHFLKHIVGSESIEPGTAIEDVLPADIAAHVKKCLAENTDQRHMCLIAGESVELAVTILWTGRRPRGCVLAFVGQGQDCHV